MTKLVNMEVSRLVFRPIPCFFGAKIDAHSRHSSVKSFSAGVSVEAGDRFSGEIRNLGYQESKVRVKPRKLNGISGSGLCDVGHVQYYSASRPMVRCGGGKKKHKDMKKKETTEILLKQLQLQAEEKELKRKRKEEKAKLKAARIQNHEESLESSDSECGHVGNVSHLKAKVHTNPTANELQQPPLIQKSTSTPSTTPSQTSLTQEERLAPTSTPVKESSDPCIGNCTNFDNAGNLNSQNSIPNGTSKRKIEVCMGGKCNKSGADLLFEELERVVGGEGSVVGCKCMGKCRNGPNVRVLNRVNGVEADEYVRKVSNPLCIGVGLEDVSLIVSKFFGGNEKDLGLATAS